MKQNFIPFSSHAVCVCPSSSSYKAKPTTSSFEIIFILATKKNWTAQAGYSHHSRALEKG